MKDGKFELSDWILETEVYNSIGRRIINAWKEGTGNWLDYVESEKEKRDYLLDFANIKVGEDLLDSAFQTIKKKDANKEDYIKCVILLDSIYSTRLDNPIRMGLEIYSRRGELIDNIINTKEVINSSCAINCVKILSEIDKKFGSHTYSFATKFCNCLNDCFPIFDSYVAGLIHKKSNMENVTLSSLGCYEHYVEIYDQILKRHSINDSYKEVDICMWTYGKIHKLAWDDDVRVSVEYSS